MDKDILMGQTAECVLLKNHAKQKYVKGQEGNPTVGLFVYEVRVKHNNIDISLDVSIKWCPHNRSHSRAVNTVRFGKEGS